jgi:hypothetical protein
MYKRPYPITPNTVDVPSGQNPPSFPWKFDIPVIPGFRERSTVEVAPDHAPESSKPPRVECTISFPKLHFVTFVQPQWVATKGMFSRTPNRLIGGSSV